MSIFLKGKECAKFPLSIVDEEWEYIDPTPDIHALFIQFDDRFFWGKLRSVEIKWSSRMTVCAGLCRYEGRRSGHCSISLSVPLLKLRPRKDLVETLLHEMIHAFLFLTNNNRDRDGHGPEFQSHMHRINTESGTRITIYHSFHDEVNLYKQHWWKCNGPCQHRKPFYGLVKRSMNRAPGPNDLWWAEHQKSCGGTFVKIREPEGFGEKKKKALEGSMNVPEAKKPKVVQTVESKDIRGFFAVAGPSQSPKLREITNETKKPVDTSPSSGLRDIQRFLKASSGSPSPTRSSRNSKNISGLSSASSAKSASAKGKSFLGSGAMMKNKGSSTVVVKDPNSRTTDEVLPTTAKPTQGGIVSTPASRNNFVPFGGTGYVLGASGSRTGPSILPGNRFKSKTTPLNSSFSLPSSEVPAVSIAQVTSLKVEIVTLDDSQDNSVNDEKVPCPVCGAHFTLVEMNAHLDSCLS